MSRCWGMRCASRRICSLRSASPRCASVCPTGMRPAISVASSRSAGCWACSWARRWAGGSGGTGCRTPMTKTANSAALPGMKSWRPRRCVCWKRLRPRRSRPVRRCPRCWPMALRPAASRCSATCLSSGCLRRRLCWGCWCCCSALRRSCCPACAWPACCWRSGSNGCTHSSAGVRRSPPPTSICPGAIRSWFWRCLWRWGCCSGGAGACCGTCPPPRSAWPWGWVWAFRCSGMSSASH